MEIIRSPQAGNKPILAMDVEGVFLVVNEEHPKTPPTKDFKQFEPTEYDFYNPQHGEWLKEVLPETDAYWLTGVGLETLELVGPQLKLPDIPQLDAEYIYGTSDTRGGSWHDFLRYKRAGMDYAFADRDIAWIDDWLASWDYEWAEERRGRGLETLLIRPEGNRGLSYHHIEQVRHWLGQLTLPEGSI